MKNFLIIGGLLALAYFVTNQKNKLDTSLANLSIESILANYNNRILVDKNGYSVYVLDGKLYAVSAKFYKDYKLINPTLSAVDIEQDIYTFYIKTSYWGGEY